ncbi:MAG TPA: O-antigen ligase family protein [Ktedonobacterales bacterium]|jgi:O-antigen ligase
MALYLADGVRRSGSLAFFIGLGLCLSFALFFFWPHPPASLLFLVVAAALASIRLEIAIALLPLTFPYDNYLLPLSASGYPQFYLAELGVIICLGAALLRHALLPAERQATRVWLGKLWRQAHPFLTPAVLLLLGASLALLVSPVQHLSLRAYREEILEPLVYFLLMLRYLRTRSDLARTVGALILSALLVACIGIAQGFIQVRGLSDILNPGAFRIRGSTNGPNNLGFLLDRAIPLLLALAFVGALRQGRGKGRHPTQEAGSQQPAWCDPLRWVCLGLLLPLVWALYWSDSHGAEIALLMVAFCFFAFEVRSKLVILVTGGAGILGIVLFWPRIVALLNSGAHGKFWERLTIWKAAVLMIRDHMLLGIGPDSFKTLYQPSAPNSYLLQALDDQRSAAPIATISHPHNFILDFWLSAGLLGVVAIFWLLGAFAVVVVRTYRRCAALPQGRLPQYLVLGIAGCMAASVIHGLVDKMYFLPDLALSFWFFLGVLLVLRTIAEQESAALRQETRKPGEEVSVMQ